MRREAGSALVEALVGLVAVAAVLTAFFTAARSSAALDQDAAFRAEATRRATSLIERLGVDLPLAPRRETIKNGSVSLELTIDLEDGRDDGLNLYRIEIVADWPELGRGRSAPRFVTFRRAWIQ